MESEERGRREGQGAVKEMESKSGSEMVRQRKGGRPVKKRWRVW